MTLTAMMKAKVIPSYPKNADNSVHKCFLFAVRLVYRRVDVEDSTHKISTVYKKFEAVATVS